MTAAPIQDEIIHSPDGPIVLVGGRGVVGRHIAAVLRSEALGPICITSRSPTALGSVDTSTIQLDLSSKQPFRFRARAVVGLVNDPDNRLMRAAVEGGVPFVDITRYTPRLIDAIQVLEPLSPRPPVVLASGWMGGIVPLIARALADQIGEVDQIVSSIVYDLSDQAGPDSVEFMDRMDAPFDLTLDGRSIRMSQLTCAGTAVLAGKKRGMLHLDTPEQWTIPRSMGARSVVTRIGFTSELATCGLHALGKVGFFQAFSGPRFESLRRGLLYANGPGGVARLVVEASGPWGGASIEIADPCGQAHLTAVGARIALGLALTDDAPEGIVFPEQNAHAASAIETLLRHGIEVKRAHSKRQNAA